MKLLNNMKKFFTSSVTWLSVLGIGLILVGQTDYMHQLIPIVFHENSTFNPVVKSIGATLLGSGVFTAIIKSKAYMDIFSKVIGDLLWSKKFLASRSDKKGIWSMLSKMIYNEKFPQISDELEEIITSEYFPTSHTSYIENSSLLINLSDHNDFFWKQSEVVQATIKPFNNLQMEYTVRSTIDLPDSPSVEDKTEYRVTSVQVNGTEIDIKNLIKEKREDNYLKNEFTLSLEGKDEYNITVNREKIVCKKTNPDKKIFAQRIIHGCKVTVICPANMNISFHKMGTVKEFKEEQNQINGPIKVMSWSYKGVILPHQGYILIFK
nr:hypothetical protein [uncultured Sediminibacterium sp.]